MSKLYLRKKKKFFFLSLLSLSVYLNVVITTVITDLSLLPFR